MSKPAKGVKGCLLWNPFTDKHFFRVYSDNHEYKDYALSAEDISIEIQDDSIVLRDSDSDNDDYGKVDWSDKVLGR